MQSATPNYRDQYRYAEERLSRSQKLLRRQCIIQLVFTGIVGVFAAVGQHEYDKSTARPIVNISSDRESIRKMLSSIPADVTIPVCGQTYGAMPRVLAIQNRDYDRLAIVCPDRAAHVVEIR